MTIVGACPAGLAAAVYGASEGLDTVLLDATGTGGQAAASSRIENYFGFPFGLSGADLTGRAVLQALKFGAQLASPCEAVKLETDRNGGRLRLHLPEGEFIDSKAVVIATGARYRALPLERWPDFEGAGIYYAATELEARGCAGSPVTVVGGANSQVRPRFTWPAGNVTYRSLSAARTSRPRCPPTSSTGCSRIRG